MAQRFDQLYRVKQGDNLGDPLYWDVRFRDIDLRLAAAEALFARMDEAVAQVTALGINRLNETFAPLIARLTAEIDHSLSLIAQAQAEVDILRGTGPGSISAAAAEVAARLAAYVVQAQAYIAQLEGLGTIDGGTFG
jgi:hypothetical protein